MRRILLNKPLLFAIIIFIGVIFSVIVAATSSDSSIISLTEHRYESWCKDVQDNFAVKQDPLSLPFIRVTIKDNKNTPQVLELSPLNSNADYIFRLLSLSREAKFFNGSYSKSSSDEEFILEISLKSTTFKSFYALEKLRLNPPAQLFLKLFNIYAKEAKP